MFSATDWVLKRVLKTLLKKSIGRFLHTEPDLDQLDVQLSTGTFELRNVLLNCDSVNAQLVRGLARGAQLLLLHGTVQHSTCFACFLQVRDMPQLASVQLQPAC
jgi:hypothetical protein